MSEKSANKRTEVGEENKTLSSIEKKRVVRVFFLQPIDPTQINGLTDLKNINLTEVVLIKKNKDSKNAGSIMPTGGQVQEGETLHEAAERESLEETHLIFLELQQLSATQEYAFMYDSRLVGRESYFFVGRLFAPKYDVPYALDEEADKIEVFVRFSLEELKELLHGKKIKGGKIFDSLNRVQKDRKKVGTVARTSDIDKVENELSEVLMQAETERKLGVLKILLNKNFAVSGIEESLVSDFESLVQELRGKNTNALKKYTKISKFWSKHINQLVDSPEDLVVALRFSNLQDIFLDLEKYKKKTGDTLPTIHMMFPIMFGLNFDSRFVDFFKSEPHLKKIYAMSRILFLYNNMQTGQRGAASERLLRKLLEKKEGKIGEMEIVEYFKRSGFLTLKFEASFKALADEIDSFFQDLQRQSQISPTLASLSHINEVEDKPFERVIKLAFGSTDRQIKFEAQRKLLLVMLAFEAKDFYQKIVGKGITQLDDLEEKLEVRESVGDRKKRKVSLQGKHYPVIIERRRKEFGSLLRKVLIRDVWDFNGHVLYGDIYGESYVFDETAMREMLEEVRVPPLSMTNGKDIKIDKYEAPLVVHNFFLELKSRLGYGEKIEILQFKGLPKEGMGVESNSVGGGARVRFLKFYIRHTDAEGTDRIREVQMFLPKIVDDKVVSGEVDFENKKEDDKRYSLARLFTHGNVYSLIELLFPHHVYGNKMKEFFKVKKHD